MDPQAVIDATRRWIESMVIGLNLCPFARRVHQGDLIRYVVTDATDSAALLDELRQEVQTLVAAPITTIETTLLIHPHALTDFLDYNDFLDDANRLLKRLRLEGVLQIASFHPRYQFAETEIDDAENFTNRSPYPMLHLLREESITRLDLEPEELLAIPRRNIDTLKRMGIAQIRARLRQGHPEGSGE